LKNSIESFLKVFGLIIISLIPTLCIYLLLDQFIIEAKLKGEVLGYTINLAGPIAFYAFLILTFRNWAVKSSLAGRKPLIVNQAELELMDEYQKIKLIYEINGEISIMEKQRHYLNASLNNVQPQDLPEITQINIDESDIRN